MSSARQKRIRRATEDIRRAISGMDFVVSGTLLVRTRKCGNPNCRCARDANAEHGPYYEWNRMIGGKLVHSWLNEEQAELISEALANHQEIQRLLKVWEARTEQEVLEFEDDDFD